jgi:hypothetical protein
VIKRISLLVTAALMAAMMMVATAAPAFAASPLAEECAAGGGTFVSSSKTCTYPVGNSGKTKTATFHDAGNGDQTGRTGPNGQSLPY